MECEYVGNMWKNLDSLLGAKRLERIDHLLGSFGLLIVKTNDSNFMIFLKKIKSAS